MAFELRNLQDLVNASFDSIIDVRASLEFAEDHLPGAINLPVLTDAERTHVGTVYKQVSPFQARKIGAAMVARNAARHIEESLSDKGGGWRPLIYCWRGGQRSSSFASILSQIGWRTEVLDGGYRSYRREVVATLYEREFPSPVVLLDGFTGTGKTEILSRLPSLGVQVLDLEGCASHRGSALGAVGTQPSQKSFETRLAQTIATLDPQKAVVIEAESSRIGQLNVPSQIFAAMRSAPRIEVRVPVEARASYLVQCYADNAQAIEQLSERLDRLIGIQGRQQVNDWQEGLRDGRVGDVARSLIQEHYDPRYAKARSRAGSEFEHIFQIANLNDQELDRAAAEIAGWIKEWQVQPVREAIPGQ